MRRSIVSLLVIMSLLMVFCAGCSSNSNTTVAEVSATMAPTATPEPTEAPAAETEEPEPTAEAEEEAEEPEPTAEAEEQATQQSTTTTTTTTTNSGTNTSTTSNSNSNSNSNSDSNTTTAGGNDSAATQDKKSVAEGLVGADIDTLYAAIGSPNGSDYTASCLVMDGEDGLLYYGDFTVSTVRYSNGSEMVMGVY